MPDVVVYILCEKPRSINGRLRLGLGFCSGSGSGSGAPASPGGGHNRLSLKINAQSGDSQASYAKKQIAVDSVAGILCILLLSRGWFLFSFASRSTRFCCANFVVGTLDKTCASAGATLGASGASAFSALLYITR